MFPSLPNPYEDSRKYKSTTEKVHTPYQTTRATQKPPGQPSQKHSHADHNHISPQTFAPLPPNRPGNTATKRQRRQDLTLRHAMRWDAGPKKRGCSKLFYSRCPPRPPSSVQESNLAVYAGETPFITSREWFGWKLYHRMRVCGYR